MESKTAIKIKGKCIGVKIMKISKEYNFNFFESNENYTHNENYEILTCMACCLYVTVPVHFFISFIAALFNRFILSNNSSWSLLIKNQK